MGLVGSFSKYSPMRALSMLRMWQFTLKNTNAFMSETVDVALVDCYGQQPFIFRNIKLKAGQSVVFNFDTVDWQWYQDDFAAIIDANNNIKKKWVLHVEYAPGECPECHGTNNCGQCRGKMYLYPRGKLYRMEKCPRCHGGGRCETCFIFKRNPPKGMGPTGPKPF